MTPRRSETQCLTEVMFCSLFSGEIMWRKPCHTQRAAADQIYFHRVVKYLFFFYYFLFLPVFSCLLFDSTEPIPMFVYKRKVIHLKGHF